MTNIFFTSTKKYYFRAIVKWMGKMVRLFLWYASAGRIFSMAHIGFVPPPNYTQVLKRGKVDIFMRNFTHESPYSLKKKLALFEILLFCIALSLFIGLTPQPQSHKSSCVNGFRAKKRTSSSVVHICTYNPLQFSCVHANYLSQIFIIHPMAGTTKLFFGSLPPSTTQAQLQELAPKRTSNYAWFLLPI